MKMCFGGKRSKRNEKLTHGKENKQLESCINKKQMAQDSLKQSERGILKKNRKGKN